eukprot:6473191-Amphidinium_carterae.4
MLLETSDYFCCAQSARSFNFITVMALAEGASTKTNLFKERLHHLPERCNNTFQNIKFSPDAPGMQTAGSIVVRQQQLKPAFYHFRMSIAFPLIRDLNSAFELG